MNVKPKQIKTKSEKKIQNKTIQKNEKHRGIGGYVRRNVNYTFMSVIGSIFDRYKVQSNICMT